MAQLAPLAVLALLLGAWSPSAALSIKRLCPADGATGQCLDTLLRMVLSGKPVHAWNGSIRIRNLATGAVVKTWEVTRNPGDPNRASVAAAWPWKDDVGGAVRNVWPVAVDGGILKGATARRFPAWRRERGDSPPGGAPSRRTG
jgi:hypothetical protein